MQPDPAIAGGDQAFIDFVRECSALVAAQADPIAVRDAVAGRAGALALTGWRMPDPAFRALQPGAPYSSYQLYLDPAHTLSIVLDIFAPGQVAPVHNHCCWGVFVCLEGRELERRYAVPADLQAPPVETEAFENGPGDTSTGDPARNAFHQVECLGEDPAVSLHIYGADIKALQRDRWDPEQGRFVSFRSGADPRRAQVSHYLTAQGLRSLE
jgi:predicted metal-dependent enzyme (double-stranded beta helix superfamily)